MTDPLGELHRRYDGPIPADELARAHGRDPNLSELRGRVAFWRENYVKAKNAWQTSIDRSVRRRFQLLDSWRFCRKGLQVAEKQLAEYQGCKEEVA